jgi:hypothetical protein
MALDPYDNVLSKLEKNSQKGLDDVRFLVRTIPSNLGEFEKRYQAELRWQFRRADREDLTMQLWIEMLSETPTA